MQKLARFSASASTGALPRRVQCYFGTCFSRVRIRHLSRDHSGGRTHSLGADRVT